MSDNLNSSKWISVLERTPPAGIEVTIYDIFYNEIHLGSCNPWGWEAHDSRKDDIAVTHWSEYPEKTTPIDAEQVYKQCLNLPSDVAVKSRRPNFRQSESQDET